jgi:hypothetical protein
MRSHFNFDVLIVLAQDVLSAALGEGWKWGRNTEWNLKYDHRNGVVNEKLHNFVFYWNLIVYFSLCNFGVCAIWQWQFLLLLRSLKMTQMTASNLVTVFCVTI